MRSYFWPQKTGKSKSECEAYLILTVTFLISLSLFLPATLTHTRADMSKIRKGVIRLALSGSRL